MLSGWLWARIRAEEAGIHFPNMPHRNDSHKPLDSDATTTDYNSAARVLTGLIRYSHFHNEKGRPRPLEVTGEAGFSELVKRHSGDMPARAVLDELLRVGAVRQRADGLLVPT